MHKEINAFFHSDKKHTDIRVAGAKNAALSWKELRNPARVVLNAVVIYFCMLIPSARIKRFFYRAIGAKIGKNVVIAPDVFIDPFFPELVEIGDNSIIGWGTKILAHEFVLNSVRLGRVKIGRNAVIGAFSVIRCGTKVGNNSVVAMMSLVNKDIDAFEMVGGVPEHEIRKIEK